MARNFPTQGVAERLLATCLVVLAATQGAWAAEPSPGKNPEIVFEKAVAPIIKAKCIRCHGEKTQKGELNLSSSDGVRKGGSSGQIVTPGKLDESPLWDMVGQDLMPPENEKPRLASEEVAMIRKWIESGAKFATADDESKANLPQPELSQHDVIPILMLRCTVCHGRNKQEGGLDLRTKASMLAGGKSGPAIVAGDPATSLLLKRVKAGEMPPSRRLIEVSIKPIAPSEIERLEQWIALGAKESNELADVATTDPDPLVSDEDRKFWSFRPPKKVEPPAVDSTSGARNPIDSFVLAKLREKGLSFAPEEDRLTLIRRVYIDLTGLPPSPSEIATYLGDDNPGAYDRLLDRLLNSPRYGERWGRYWLDLAGYSDSEGATSPDRRRPWAYRYRDYVIRAFNADKPYDRFLLEQIAGDELTDYEHAPEITQEIYDNLVATQFLGMAPNGTWERLTNFVPNRLEVVADEIKVLGSTVMGLTLHCARCHTHKFDPVPHRDYYRLAAILKPAFDEHDWLGPTARYLPYVMPQESAAVEEQNRVPQKRIDELKTVLDRQTAALRTKVFEQRLEKIPAEAREELRRVFNTAADKRDESQKRLAETHKDQLEIDDKALAAADPEYAKTKARVTGEIGALEGKLQPKPMVSVLWDRGDPSPTYILRRGDYQNATRLVGPGVPSMLTDGKTPFEVKPPWPGAKSTGRRLALARWLTQPDHPLTARVMVNRIWKHHFGRGIVTTLDNFGKTGAPPSHPELLDWLARHFVESGWSIKAMHRLMMTSTTYRQSSQIGEQQLKLDPANHLLSRMPVRRVEGEVVRDAILVAAGALVETPLGPPDPVDVRKDGLVTVRGTERGWRRSIYALQQRTEIPTLLDSFDYPQMSPNCIERGNSIVAPQALQLMNNGWVHDMARRFAERVMREVGSDPQRQLEHAYLLALARQPTSQERQATSQTLASLTRRWEKVPATVALTAMTDLWIRELEPDKVWENDHVWVATRPLKGEGFRYGVVEFDIRPLVELDISEVRLELGVQNQGPLKQVAACIPAGIEELSWSAYQSKKASQLEPLDSLGSYHLPATAEDVGKYLASQPASPRDLERLKARAASDGKLAIVLMPADGVETYSCEWDDGSAPKSHGNRPRLMVRHGNLSADEAGLRALTNVCHALFNCAEFIYVE